MKRYEFDIAVPTEKWGFGGGYCTYSINVPTTMNELERIIIKNLVGNDPHCQDARTYWKNLREVEGNDKEEPTQKIYQTIFGKMNTYYWQHRYAEVVFHLVRGLMETTRINPNEEEVSERVRSLPKNNYDGSGYDCAQRCHERAATLLSIAADKNYRFKVEELK